MPSSGHARPVCGLRDFSEVCDAVEKSPGRLDKIRQLAAYLGSLPDDDLKVAATWLSGRPFGRSHRHRALKVGPAVIRQALLQTSGLPLARYKSISATQNESARTARLLLEQAVLKPAPMSLESVAVLLGQLAESDGSLVKSDRLGEVFRALHPAEAASVVKIVNGGLRIGSKEGLLEDAVGEAFGESGDAVREAHMLVGDLGEVAVLAKAGRLASAQLRPLVAVKPMLASPEPTAEAIWDRLGAEGSVWLEEKFDGIRAQIHKAGDQVAIFSRDLRPLDGEFPELLDEIRGLNGDFILDGEIIAYAEGRKLSFFDLQKRLGRTKGQGDLFLGAAVPVKFVAFDTLHVRDRDLLKESLETRREFLESLDLVGSVQRIEVVRAKSIDEVEKAFKEAKKAGNEGLIAKAPASHYSPGRRGKSWLKLKQAMPTLDCVVIKAQQGHGRRAEVLSDYTFALREATSGQLMTVGKAYSGLTDLEIEELTDHFKEYTLSVARRVHTVEPNLVLEIAFDSIRRSKRHDSGLAMRFPRIKAIRRDKTLNEIDTVSYAETLLDG
jgi:DNA ligase-1